MEPHKTQQLWEESLDISNEDNDDFPSLLRPCKRKTPPLYPSASTGTQLENLSTISQSLTFSQTLEPSSQFQPQLPKPSPRRIPGPAGAVQAAMHRRMCNDKDKLGFSGLAREEELVSTQEYVRRVVEEGDEHDDDFSSNSWLSAVQFVCSNGLGDADALGTPLNLIKKCHKTTRRVSQVVAMIKSFSPNGFGDAMVTLKDPSGTIGASVHRKVLAEEEFGKNILVGAVMILKKVVAFSPSRSAHHLNITITNMVKVISKDSGPPSKNFSASPVKRSTSEIVATLGTPQKGHSSVRERSEIILANMRRTMQSDTKNKEQLSSHENQILGLESEILLANKEYLIKEGMAAEVTVEEHSNIDCQGVRAMQIDESNIGHDMQYSNSNKANGDHETVNITNQTISITSETTLPEWTDEQLDVLFADGSLL